ncbi:hypothetical protein BpHYR1_038555 [Brachionus plicatilis]|uniref:Uncharacterized protein n=1 Tax=Brachionus plicatilis TaxID=10195 RepID=A0A3M7R3N6_BRAPC|nr:hypothetical protein BpHYR1_038555 [Brachionus plicatilis]
MLLNKTNVKWIKLQIYQSVLPRSPAFQCFTLNHRTGCNKMLAYLNLELHLKSILSLNSNSRNSKLKCYFNSTFLTQNSKELKK